MKILNFKDYIYESYLNGGRQPLYHSTKNLKEVLDSDKLIPHKTAYKHDRDAICLSRDKSFNYMGIRTLVLDVDKLKRFGYRPIPIDEVGSAITYINRELSKEGKPLKFPRYNKVDTSFKVTKNGLGLKTGKVFNLGHEYEERIYKPINNLGKFVIEIIVDNNWFNDYKNALTKYIKKYPHIKVVDDKNNLLLDIDLIIKDTINCHSLLEK